MTTECIIIIIIWRLNFTTSPIYSISIRKSSFPLSFHSPIASSNSFYDAIQMKGASEILNAMAVALYARIPE